MSIPTKTQIEEILDERVRPLLQLDGGNARVDRVQDDGTVVLCFTGRCAGCPGVDQTLEALVEPTLRQAYPDIRKIIVMPWHLPFFGSD